MRRRLVFAFGTVMIVAALRLLDGVARELSPRWQVTKMYYAGGYPEPTVPPTEAAMYDLLNAGAGLILHTGHGETNRWDHCCTVTGLTGVKNADRLPVLFSAGCSTAHFAPLAPYDAYTDADGTPHRGTDHGEVFSAPPPPPAAAPPKPVPRRRHARPRDGRPAAASPRR